MQRRQTWFVMFGLGALVACNAGVNSGSGGTGGLGSGSNATGVSIVTSGGGNGQGSTTATGFATVSGTGGTGGVPINPCGTECGPTELCDGVNKGKDDNCDGVVDEGCPCSPGEAESCFEGDPSYLTNPGCFPGTQHCSENGTWGPCIGGNQPTDDPPCFSADLQGCHPISSVPFSTTNLADGCGNFDDDADPGSSDWSIMCPPGVTPCPTADAAGHVQLISSGEYNVTYTKNVGGVPNQCTYPVYVGAPGLRVELSWEFEAGVDVDLHMHEPNTTTDFQGNPDCGYANCKAGSYSPYPGTGANWFPAAPQPPGFPVDWHLSPNLNENTCYFAPDGYGATWQGIAHGCHNPRLDIDNITCTPSVTDPNNSGFCAPENINVDYPPTDQWTRIAVHYYGAHSTTQTIHPDIKIYCNGALSAELGASGFGNPEAPLAWEPASTGRMWTVADVRFKSDQCNGTTCEVVPVYENGDTTLKAPLYKAGYGGPFGPAYPP